MATTRHAHHMLLNTAHPYMAAQRVRLGAEVNSIKAHRPNTPAFLIEPEARPPWTGHTQQLEQSSHGMDRY